jgi:hypothetical protein
MYGWECPRCHKIWAPAQMTCDCQPPSFVSTNLSMNFWTYCPRCNQYFNPCNIHQCPGTIISQYSDSQQGGQTTKG